MLDLNDLRLFVRIVENKGIVRASKALQLPKSTISRRLAGLEEHLKARLIVRSGDEFGLTSAGEEVYRAARDVVGAAQRAEDLLLGGREDIGGRVSIQSATLFSDVIGELVAAELTEFASLSFALELSAREPEMLSDRIDLYLLAHHWQLRDTSLIQRRICRNPLVLVAAPGFKAPSSPQALPNDRLLIFDNDPNARLWHLEHFDGSSHDLGAIPRLISTDARLLVQMAEAGAGIALVPEYAARQSLNAGSLVLAVPGWIGPAVTISLLSPSRRLMNRTLRREADRLADQVKHAVLLGDRQVPDSEHRVPTKAPGHFIPLSHSVPSQGLRITQAGLADALDTTLAESELAMTPFSKAFGIAALTAVATLPLPAIAQDETGPLVLYTNDFEGVITDRFEADTGRQIDVVQMSGGEILARIAAEASNPQWDVLIYNGSYVFQSLDQQGQLMQNVEPDNIGNLNEIGLAQLPENRSWFPIGQAASCVMLYRTDLVDTPPARYADLADARFNGQFGMADPAVAAPAYPCVAEFFHELGQEGAEALFTSFFDNGMRVFRTNGPVGQAIAAGDLSVAMITSQVAYSLKAAGETPVEIVWPEDGAPGVVRGVGIQARTARPEAAKAFVQWLLVPETQTYLANAVAADGLFEPTVTGAARRADGPPEGMIYRVAPNDFAVENEAAIKTWFADRAVQ